MKQQVIQTALQLSVWSFWVFVAATVVAFGLTIWGAGRQTAPRTDATAANAGAIAAVTEAFAKLAEALSKASPATAALLASLFFMLIAATCAELGDVKPGKPDQVGTPL